MRKKVTCKETLTVQTHRIMPTHTNSFGNLFGGQLLYFLDNAASISQSRFTNALSMTVSLDNMNFIKALPEENSVCIESYVSGSGNRSVEVFVKVIGENLMTSERYIAATSFLTFVVQLSDEEKADFIMPEIIPESEEEKYICSAYEKRRAARILNREHDLDLQKNLSIKQPWIQEAR